MVPLLHAAVAALIALASALMWGVMSNDGNDAEFRGLVGVELMLVPLAGGIVLGLLFRSAGRGQTMLRSADAASILVGLVALSAPAGSILWLIAVAIVTLATTGLLVTFLDRAPHRAGWRSHRDGG
jgi:hypothetical protein